MKKNIVLFLILILFSAPSFASEITDLPEGISGYLAAPEDLVGNQFSFVILVHDWWGMSPHLIEKADELARDGFICFAIDLYHGRRPANAPQAYEFMSVLSENKMLGDLERAYKHFIDHPSVNRERVGIVGWSYGARLSLDYTLAHPFQIHALGIYYPQVGDDENLSKLKTPLVGFFGREDRGVPVTQVRAFKFRLEQMSKRAGVHFYPEVGHGFFNPESLGYNEIAARDAWQKTLEFLKVNLA